MISSFQSSMIASGDFKEFEIDTACRIYQLCSEIHGLPKTMSKITEHLYLGNFDDATDIKKLKNHGITHVLCTIHSSYRGATTGPELYHDQFKYFGFLSQDSESYPILTKHFDKTYKFIEDARINNGKCLIHCQAGINRSGCLATAYYMVYQNIDPISAVKHVLKQRGTILSNEGFIKQLVKFASENDLIKMEQKDATKIE